MGANVEAGLGLPKSRTKTIHAHASRKLLTLCKVCGKLLALLAPRGKPMPLRMPLHWRWHACTLFCATYMSRPVQLTRAPPR